MPDSVLTPAPERATTRRPFSSSMAFWIVTMARESGSPGVGPPRQATPVVLVGTQALGQDAQMIQLYAESFAPWCEKARWALDHHRVAYRYTEHVPMVGELRLRLAARKLRGVVTVPLLVTGSGVLMDSVAIARAAEGLGGPPEKGPQTLFPEGEAQALAQWNLWSEIVMTSGRALLLGRMLRHPEAREQLPPFVPKGFRPMLQPLAAQGTRFLVRKNTASSPRRMRT